MNPAPALAHPDAHGPASAWSEDQILHVAACYSNPFRWRTRRELANDFRQHMARSPNVRLTMIELAYGDRPFEVTTTTDIQLRTRSELFHKENLLNLAVARFPQGWRYGAVIDADWQFTRHDWALETIHLLQHHDWVQLFSSYSNVTGESQPGDGHRPISTHDGFVYRYVQNDFRIAPEWQDGWAAPPYGSLPSKTPLGSPGGAWGFTREGFDAVGGMLDRCILGSGDHFMAFGLAGQLSEKYTAQTQLKQFTSAYRDYVRAWQLRAARTIRGNIGYLDAHCIHHFHGPMHKRGYSSRDSILVDCEFDPNHDVYPDAHGVLQMTDDKPRLRDKVRQYFRSRSEDLPHAPATGR